MPKFFLDTTNGVNKSYSDLIADLNLISQVSKFCYSDDTYSIFKSMLISILADKELCLLDFDFSKKELKNLLGENFDLEDRYAISIEPITSFEDLKNRINKADKWRLKLYTSGTTGLPKEIKHSFQSLTKATKISEKFRNKVWGYAYNPTHMAGVQVFFQAFMNQNQMVNLFHKNIKLVCNAINENSVTNLSATPTFYRLLLSEQNFIAPSVERVTFGGERFSSQLNSQLTKVFPNSKIKNIYASTEAGAILSSIGEYFQIRPEFKDSIKIEKHQLYIHKSHLGESNSIQLDNQWYNTGDIVEFVDTDSFRFVSRSNEMINVGGYKINPAEVEEVIIKLKEVSDARIFPKSNSVLGKII